MKKIFFISGLGADRRAFDLIEEFPEYQKVFIDWIPNTKNENLTSYSKRIVNGISFSEQDTIIGLSFGGLIAQQIAKMHPIDKIILVSSFRDKKDLKPILQTLLNLRLYYLIPNFRISFLSKLIRSWFNVRSKSGQHLLDQMVNQMSPKFMKWAMEKIRESAYKNSHIETHNIIGNKDKILKYWVNNQTYKIPEAGHFMVYENAKEVNKALKEIIL